MYIFIYIFAKYSPRSIYTYMYTYIYINTYINTYIYTYIHIYIHIHIHIYYTRHWHEYYIYTQTHAHTHPQTHTHTLSHTHSTHGDRGSFCFTYFLFFYSRWQRWGLRRVHPFRSIPPPPPFKSRTLSVTIRAGGAYIYTYIIIYSGTYRYISEHIGAER